MYGRTVLFERFTEPARRVVVLAQEEARLLKHSYIGTEHLLLGLMNEEEGIAARVLTDLGIDLPSLRHQVEEIIGVGTSSPRGHIPFTPRSKSVLEMSLRESLQLGHNYIGTEHILLGLLREGEGVAAQILNRLGVDLTPIRDAVIELVGSNPEAVKPPRRIRPPAQTRCPHPDEQLVITRLEAGIRTVRCDRCGQLIATFPDP